MPRKQNGFGNPKSLGFKGAGRVDRGKGVGAFGSYPSKRRYGSIVNRTIIEKFNIDETWSKWRKGYEYFVKQRWVSFELPDFSAEIFPSFQQRMEVRFEATRFPTSGSDDATYYVTKRKVEKHPWLAKVNGRLQSRDGTLEKIQKENNEYWMACEFNPSFSTLLKLEKESLTSKPYSPAEVGYQERYTSAIVKNILTFDSTVPPLFVKNQVMPAVYQGNSNPLATELTIRVQNLFIDDGSGTGTEDLAEDKVQGLVGKQISIFNAQPYYNVVPENYQFTEIDAASFGSTVEFRGSYAGSPCGAFIYDAKPLTSDAGVIYQRDILAFSPKANFGYSGNFVFDKARYQRWFNVEFSAALMEEITEFSAPLIPTALTIQSIEKVTASTEDARNDENYIIKCVPFNSQILYCKRPYQQLDGSELVDAYILSYSSNSFTQEINELDFDGSLIQTKLNVNVNPFQDEVFLKDEYLWLQDKYSCDCPSFSKARVTAPEARMDMGNKANRQRRYPLPSAGANRSKDIIDNKNSLAGIFDIWRTEQDELKFRSCKHTMAAYFAGGFKVIEPNEIPMMQDREKIEEKVVEEVNSESISAESVRRAELSATGFVWSIVQLMVQSTATLISTATNARDIFLKPIEFMYGFKKVRKLVTEPTVDNTVELLKVKPSNIVDLSNL